MQLVGHRDVLGLPVRDALPDIEGQGFLELLDQVFASGEPFIGTGSRPICSAVRMGPTEERFVDLIFQPVRDPNGGVIGIFVAGRRRHRAAGGGACSAPRAKRSSAPSPRPCRTMSGRRRPTGRSTGSIRASTSIPACSPGELDGARLGAAWFTPTT